MTTSTGTHDDIDELAKVEFDKAIDTLLGSAVGRKKLVIKAEELGLLEGNDRARLAFEFFTNPDFARAVSDKVWAAGQQPREWWRTLDPVEQSAWRGRATCGLYGCAECRPSLAVNRTASDSDTIEWAYPRRLIEVASCTR